MKSFIVLIACGAIASIPVSAQQTPNINNITPPPAPILAPTTSNELSPEPEVSLDELIRLAQQNSPRLTIAQESQTAARQRAEAVRAARNPTLQLVPGIGGTREARDEEVIVSQPLDVFGLRRARTGIATAELRRAQAESNLTTRALVVEVKNAAAALFAAQEAESLEQVQVAVAQLFRDAAARSAELGDVPPVQVQRAELELLRLQNDLTNAQAERLTRRTALNQLIGQPPATPLRVASPLDAATTALLRAPLASTQATSPGNTVSLSNDKFASNPSTPDSALPTPGVFAPATNSGANATTPDATAPDVTAPDGTTSNVTTAGTIRPDIASAQATLELRQAQAQAARRESRPRIEVQARRSAFFGRNGSYALRAVVTLPLLDFGAIKGERRAIEAEARAQAATVQLLEQQAVAQAENARLRMEQSRQNATRYREKILPLTLDLLRKTQIGYTQGASTYLEVLEAQRTLRQVQTEYLQALINLQTAEIALEAARWGGAPLDALSFDTRPANRGENRTDHSTIEGTKR